MSLDKRLGRLEDAERDAEARAMARDAGMPLEEVRRQFVLWQRLLVVHGLAVGEQTQTERIRAFLIDFATRIGDEDPGRYADETINEWTGEEEHRREQAAREDGR